MKNVKEIIRLGRKYFVTEAVKKKNIICLAVLLTFCLFQNIMFVSNSITLEISINVLEPFISAFTGYYGNVFICAFIILLLCDMTKANNIFTLSRTNRLKFYIGRNIGTICFILFIIIIMVLLSVSLSLFNNNIATGWSDAGYCSANDGFDNYTPQISDNLIYESSPIKSTINISLILLAYSVLIINLYQFIIAILPNSISLILMFAICFSGYITVIQNILSKMGLYSLSVHMNYASHKIHNVFRERPTLINTIILFVVISLISILLEVNINKRSNKLQ